MPALITLLPGSVIKQGERRLVIVDYQGLEAIIAREVGKKGLISIPLSEVGKLEADSVDQYKSPDLLKISEKDWREALERFRLIEPLLRLSKRQRTEEEVKRVAAAAGRHMVTIYRWIEDYGQAQRLSALLRKRRSDSGRKRIPKEQEEIIEAAVKAVFLTAEMPSVADVVEEVRTRCAEKGLTPPHGNTVRSRIAQISGRTLMEKRRNKKVAAERYEPIRGHFPGADYPLAVAQIDHTPVDVIIVDEHDRQPIGRPYLTIVIDVFSRMILGFAIYLEAPSAFTSGLAITHAVLPKDEWLAEMGLEIVWPCWGKMRKLHSDNAKEFRGTVIGRACEEHNITVEHRPRGQPRYGGHVERGFRTFMERVHRLKGSTFSNVKAKRDYDSEGRAIMTRRELELWLTIYIAKAYPNKYHYGIKTTPRAKFEAGIQGTDDQVGTGLPDRIADPHAFMLDFLPFEERTVQEYGLLISHVYYYDDALRPWIHALNPEDPTKSRKFVVRVNPRDMREVYFRDPDTNSYITIPYRDRSHPPTSRWEIQQAETRLREAGYANVNEALIFQALADMREIEDNAERLTKKARRAKEKRDHQPALPAKKRTPSLSPDAAPPTPLPNPAPATAEAHGDDYLAPFDGIVEPD